MLRMQKAGGIAALIEAAAYVFGFVLLGAFLAPAGYGTDHLDPQQTVAFLREHQALMYLWILVIYVVFGVFLVVLALALHERLRASALASVATAFGLIWAGLVIASGMVFNLGLAGVVELFSRNPEQAGSAWLSIAAVQEGLGGGNEIVGGLWVLLASWAALQTKALPPLLNYLGLLIGVAGLVTVIPGLSAVGAVFGLGQIAWFIWLGIVLLSRPARVEAQPPHPVARTLTT